MAEYGVKVTIAEPGYLRTSFLTPDALAFAINADGAYTGIAQMIADHQALQGSQSGDPAAAARAIIDLVDRGDTRLRQLLGSDAYQYATAKVEALRADVEGGKEIAFTTDFPAPPAA